MIRPAQPIRYLSFRGVGADLHDPANPASTPDLDAWGYDTWWTIEQWMQWHQVMKVAFGQDEANRRFLMAWNQQSLGAGPIDARSFNSTFRAYAKANGFFDGLYSGAGDVLAKPLGTANDVVTAGSNAVSSAADTIGSAGSVLVPLAVLLLAGSWLLPQLGGLKFFKRKRR